MAYYIDLATIKLADYCNKLEKSYLPPSRMLLKKNIIDHFHVLEKLGLKNVKDLQQALKKKDKLIQIAKNTGISEDYLVILLREINSIQPKPNKLVEFAGISSATISKLEECGIKDTEKLFEKVKTKKSRKELQLTLKIIDDELLELTKLTDLSRIKWTGATFAQMLYHAGFDTVKKASEADFNELHKKINELNSNHKYFKGTIGLNDIKILIEAAREVPQEIEYKNEN